MIKINRGDIVLVNLDPVIGSEQGKIRPAVVIQNNIGNEYSPTTIIAPITSKSFSKEFPTNVELFSKDSGLDNVRIIKKMHSLSKEIMDRIDFTIKISLGLN